MTEGGFQNSEFRSREKKEELDPWNPCGSNCFSGGSRSLQALIGHSADVATVRNIGVVKPRHIREAKFAHLVVVWHGTNGDCSADTVMNPRFLDSRSVVLLRLGDDPGETLLFDPGDADTSPFLNLSPFILDENTFEETPTKDVSKLYFFAGLENGPPAAWTLPSTT